MKNILKVFLVLTFLTFMSSCYTYTYNVGDGPQKGIEVKKQNHYFIFGLATGNISDPQKMAGDAENYSITIQHTFINGLVNALTFGIYTPTTTTVIK